jgi:phospholipid/cholesterol/gamma-HCH transport system substrate-binding protein
MQNLESTSDKLDKLLDDLREVLRAVAQGDGTLRRFIADPTLYNQLTDAACMVTRILPRLDRVLRDVEVFADKIARHPESLGVGGAVRPSAGLKEPPSSGTYHPRP